MIHEQFHSILKRAIGLDVQSVGGTAVTRAVEERARNCKIDDLERYLDKVINDPSELQALVETVVVPETWFFRDQEAFSAAAKVLQQRWPQREPFKVLSVPCSTGEEPYTIAMALMNSGLPPAAFNVLAIDVSNASIKRARAGVYGRNSFRGRNLEFRDRYFTETTGGYRISDEVRSSVKFKQGNLFELDDLASDSFDIVFCRNLLIYFDAADQLRAAAALKRLVSPQGTLFVGHSETRVMIEAGLTSLRIPNAFAFTKTPAKPKEEKAVRPKAAAVPETPTKRAKVAPAAEKSKPAPKKAAGSARGTVKRSATSSKPLVPAATVSIEDIQSAADRGDLQRAVKLGQELIKTGSANADALHLLAVISDAAGDEAAAADYYRKTLYLEPDHHEALTHLALLLDRKGDAVGARRVRDRAQRIDARRGG